MLGREIVVYSAAGAAFPRGEGGPASAGSEEEWRNVGHRNRPETLRKPSGFRPHSSSVTALRRRQLPPPGEAMAPLRGARAVRPASSLPTLNNNFPFIRKAAACLAAALCQFSGRRDGSGRKPSKIGVQPSDTAASNSSWLFTVQLTPAMWVMHTRLLRVEWRSEKR